MQNLLAPQHSHVVVHLAGFHQFTLRRVPDFVVRFGILKLLQRVEMGPLVITRFEQRLLRPVRQ